MLQQSPPSQLMQDLGQLAFHARALARRHDHHIQRLTLKNARNTRHNKLPRMAHIKGAIIGGV
jgi:hypothetical protein